MQQTSECVSLGHPDKVADYISCYLLDRYLEKDPFTRFAVECQIKDNAVTLGGEVSSSYDMGFDEVRAHVVEAVKKVGYTRDYLKRWGAANTIWCGGLAVNCYIGKQSPDIARGVDADGWGDQGIFWGMATTNHVSGYMPLDHFIARQFCDMLYDGANQIGCGIDIKTQVETLDDKVSKLVIACPALSDNVVVEVRRRAKELAPTAEIIVNGTGRYVVHGPVGDCGTTGRKLAVDFYGGNCRIGGGSPWTKDGTKADVALNLYARKLALAEMRRRHETIYAALASVIGRREVSVVYFNKFMQQVGCEVIDRPAGEIIDELNLRQPTFAQRCREGLFFDIA